MARFISPRAPYIRVAGSSLPESRGCVRTIGRSSIRGARRGLLLLPSFVLSVICFPSVLAQTPAQIEFETFETIYKWLVFIAIAAVFIIQAFLIIRLLTAQRRRDQAEVESRHLAMVAKSEQKRLEEVVSQVPGIVWEGRLDPTGKWSATFINDYAEKVTGYKLEEWLTTPGLGFDIVHEEDREKVALETAAVFVTGKPVAIRFRWIAKDGHIVWVEAHIAPLMDETGAIVGIRGVTLDVTEQHQAAQARRQSEERFAKAFRANPQPTSLATLAEGRFVDVNDSFLETSGYSRDEVIGRTSLELNIWETSEHRADIIEHSRLEQVVRLRRIATAIHLDERRCW